MGPRIHRLPMNGVQRVLCAVAFYHSQAVFRSQFEYIKKIRDKERYAAIITTMFRRSFDKEIKEIQSRVVPPQIDALFRDE